jgi:hypothetical protein
MWLCMATVEFRPALQRVLDRPRGLIKTWLAGEGLRPLARFSLSVALPELLVQRPVTLDRFHADEPTGRRTLDPMSDFFAGQDP